MSRHSSGLTGGIAVGAFLWGEATASWGVGASVAASGIALLATALVGLFLPMPRVSLSELERVEVGREPEVALQLTSRSGPIVIEIDYTVDAGQARPFYAAMLKLQNARKRNGAFQWSFARRLADPGFLNGCYHSPTWGDP